MMMTVITHAIAFGAGIALMAVFGLKLRAEFRRIADDAYTIKKDLEALKDEVL